MQFFTDNFFYSNVRIGVDQLEDDRQVLVEEQKSCKARARKFFLDTNRRRKALEERRRQWDVQEQRLRENILQQRKQSVQDATERFQRAHLPPSQRRRQSFRKSTPNIEEALNHIQGTLSSYARQSSFLSSSSTLSRSCTPSPKPPTVSISSCQQRTLSAVEAYTKLMQERSLNSFKNSQLLFLNELQETQLRDRETRNPQDHHENQIIHSESLSSLDSLEKDLNHNSTINIGCSSECSLEQLEMTVERHQSTQKNLNGLCLSSDMTLCPTNNFLSKNLLQQNKSHASPQLKSRLHNLPQATGGPNSIDQPSNTEAQPPLSHQGLLTLSGIIGTSVNTNNCDSRTSGLRDTISVIACCKSAPDSTRLEFSCLTQDGKLDLRQQVRNQEDKYFKNPSATKIILPTKNCSHKDVSYKTLDAVLNFNTKNIAVREDTTIQPTATECTTQSHRNKFNDAMNNLNEVANSEPKVESSKNTELLNQTCDSNIRSDFPKCLKCPSEEIREILPAAVISGSDSRISEIRFVKGILKKQSKYVSGDAKSLYGAGHLIFTKQVALSIRDSVELTREKAKDVEGNKTVKKKLRWFDEVTLDDEEKVKNTNLLKQNNIKSKPAYPPHNISNSADHQQSQTVALGAPRAAPITTPPASPGYHFTKQAWADVGVQDSKLQEHGVEDKVQRSSVRAGCPRVPRRVRSARVGVASVSSCSRKGTVIRRQFATEASHVAKAQGKILEPRPPPRTEVMNGNAGETAIYITKTPYGVDHSNVRQGLHVEQALSKDNLEYFSPSHTDVIRTDSGIIFTPLQPSYAYPSYEVATKGTPTTGHQQSQGSNCRRGLMYDEKGLCLDRTPTDEEISQLWHGVRSALATTEVGDPRNILTHNGLPQTRANISHVTINGDSLISGVNAVTRMGGFFLSPSNARSLVSSQTLEKTRRRACVEQSRQALDSGNRRLPLPSQPTVQITPFPSKYDLTHQDEGSECAAQFQLAEPHSKGLLADTVATMETVQTQRPTLLQQRRQHQGLNNISLEEQKVLFSLDRLNHRLQYVQEVIGGNAGAKGVLHVDVPFVEEGMATAHHKYRTLSADSRPRTQRRF